MGAPGQPDVLEQYVTLFSEKFGFSEEKAALPIIGRSPLKCTLSN